MGNPRVLLVGGGVTAAAIAAQLSKATCRTVMHFSASKPTKDATLVGKITWREALPNPHGHECVLQVGWDTADMLGQGPAARRQDDHTPAPQRSGAGRPRPAVHNKQGETSSGIHK